MDAELRAALQRHQLDPIGPDPIDQEWRHHCAVCGQAWPCDAARALAALDAAESPAEPELHRSRWHVSDGSCGYCAADHGANEADFMNGRLVRRRLVAPDKEAET